MGLASLAKTKAHKVLGIDASTNSVAFCLMDNGIPVKWGKIEFVGSDIYEKIYDAKVKVHAMLNELKADYIAVEGAVLVRSPDAVIKLSYVYGVVIAELMSTGSKVTTISPTAWQAFIGNKNPTKAEKEKLRNLKLAPSKRLRLELPGRALPSHHVAPEFQRHLLIFQPN